MPQVLPIKVLVLKFQIGHLTSPNIQLQFFKKRTINC